MAKKSKNTAPPKDRGTFEKIGWHQTGPRRGDLEYSHQQDDYGGMSEYEVHQMQGR